jgi:hypothetical protein
MRLSCLRFGGLALLALLSAVITRAQSTQYFSGPTYIDFNARGGSSYDLEFFASTVVGGSSYASAWASYGSLYTSGYSYYGESGAGFRLYNVHSNGHGTWTADTVETWQFGPGGYWESSYSYYQPVSSSGTADGQAYCDGYSQGISGSITQY